MLRNDIKSKKSLKKSDTFLNEKKKRGCVLVASFLSEIKHGELVLVGGCYIMLINIAGIIFDQISVMIDLES